MRYFKRVKSLGWRNANEGRWERGYIFRAPDDAEFLEDYVKYPDHWFTRNTGAPHWLLTQFYVRHSGTGTGNCFKEITEAEAFVEIL